MHNLDELVSACVMGSRSYIPSPKNVIVFEKLCYWQEIFPDSQYCVWHGTSYISASHFKLIFEQ
jgi:hypothetical protein